MSATYRIHKGWRIATQGISIIFLVSSTLWLFLLKIYDWWFYTTPVFMIIISVIFIWYTMVYRVIITTESITTISIFRQKTLLIKNIKDFLYAEYKHAYILTPLESILPKIEISAFIEKHDEVLSFLKQHIQDKEEAQKIHFEQQLYKNKLYGRNFKERSRNIKTIQGIVYFTTVISLGCFLWTTLHPKPYMWAIYIPILLPWLCFALMYIFRGQFTTFALDESAESLSLEPLIYVPMLALSIRFLLDCNIYDYSNAWLPTIAISLAITLIYFHAASILSIDAFKNINLYVFWALMFSYTFFSFILLNKLDDKSEPQYFKVKVLNLKEEDFGSAFYTYTAETSPFAKFTESQELDIHEKTYHELAPNDSVWIVKKQGNFHVPWVEIRLIKSDYKHL